LAGETKNRCLIRQGGAFVQAGDFALHFNEVLSVALSPGTGPAQHAVQPAAGEFGDSKGIADSL
jgi:methyl coenzyme M reductase subunit C